MNRVLYALLGLLMVRMAAPESPHKALPTQALGCRQVVLEGEVRAGQAFDRVFAHGFRFFLEPLASGWIVRVLASDEPRGPHDYAELATPPYRSPNPLLLSTDWAFRAQDAIAWNPRRFRYAGSARVFHELEALYSGVMAGNGDAAGKAATLAAAQPEGVLQILDARLSPGLADQGKMASSVALNLSQTPHEVDQSPNASPLGRLESIRFRVRLELPARISPAPGVVVEKKSCSVPTTGSLSASHFLKR